MGEASHPGIYIRHDGEEYYVGQSKDIRNRDVNHHGRLVATFVGPEDRYELRRVETEMIQFMDAAGVPLANIHQRDWPRVGIELEDEYA